MQQQNTKVRIAYIDALKAFAIFLVLWGHVLQNLYGTYDFFHNKAFEIIYAFHMPLFFMVSGFFFTSSLKQQPIDFIKKKAIQLLLPCFVWATLLFVSKNAITIIQSGSLQVVIGQLPLLYNPSNWPFWFLKQLFVSFVLVYTVIKLFRKPIAAFLLSFLVVMFLPAAEYQRFLLPMFWLGIALKANYDFIQKNLTLVLFTSGVLFLCCLYLWDGNYTIYKTGFPALFPFYSSSLQSNAYAIAALRWIVGAMGSLFFLLIFSKLYHETSFSLG